MRKLDAIVLGSGLSGSYCAALLAQKGLQVAIISPRPSARYHLPESWIFSPSEHLISLGVIGDLTRAMSHSSKCRFSSVDGKKTIEILINNESEDFHVGDIVRINRNLFDEVLLNKAQNLGANLVAVDQIMNCSLDENEVNIQFRVGDSIENLSAKKVIDASGKSAFLANHLDLPREEFKLDARYACFTHFEGEDMPFDCLQIFSLDQGYLFWIPINKNRVSVGCVVSESQITLPLDFEKIFHSSIQQSELILHLLKKMKRVIPIIPIKNQQIACRQSAGKNYRLVGDAAIFMDPFFCPGINFAFSSVEQAINSLESENAESYQSFVNQWLSSNQRSVYEGIKLTDWAKIMRIFADPHLPYIVPLLLTQSFGQITGKSLDFENGINLAREAYEYAVH